MDVQLVGGPAATGFSVPVPVIDLGHEPPPYICWGTREPFHHFVPDRTSFGEGRLTYEYAGECRQIEHLFSYPHSHDERSC